MTFDTVENDLANNSSAFGTADASGAGSGPEGNGGTGSATAGASQGGSSASGGERAAAGMPAQAGAASGGSAQAGAGGEAAGGEPPQGGAGQAGASSGGCTPAPAGPGRDADGDGVVDALDPDDDNDGMSDLSECFTGASRIVNGGFETPGVTPTDRDWDYLDTRDVPGWSNDTGKIEVWKSGNYEVPSAVGLYYIELSAQELDTMWQDIDTVPGTTLRWAFWHRARLDTNIVELLVGKAGGVPTSQGTFTTDESWELYEGTVVIPSGQTRTRFAFEHIFPSVAAGNFLDQIDAEPICTRDSDQDGCVDTEDPD